MEENERRLSPRGAKVAMSAYKESRAVERQNLERATISEATWSLLFITLRFPFFFPFSLSFVRLLCKKKHGLLPLHRGPLPQQRGECEREREREMRVLELSENGEGENERENN